jgi:mono/diheme cytochrome c family protein
MRATILFSLVTAGLVTAGAARAADPKIVTYFNENCATCHGEKGEGMKGLAPPFKGNKYVTDSSHGELANTITKGRAGDQKKYKHLPSPMPPNSKSESRLKGTIDYIKTDLQK